jgi:excisionase family DNA binding protein
MTNLLDKKELSQLMGISTRTIDRLRAKGKLRAVKAGNSKRSRVLFESEQVKEFMRKHRERD